MSSFGTFLRENNIELIREELTQFPDNTEQNSFVCYIPISLVQFNPKNNRFRPKQELTEAEQSELLKNQNPASFGALVKSISDQPCFEAVKLEFKNDKLIIIDGHRRIEAARESNRSDFLAIVYNSLNQEQFDYLSEWNEENPTKLPHEAFYKARGIALPIIESQSAEERENTIARLKRRNIKQAQIDKAINTVMYISDFARQTGESEEKRFDQYKAFETVAQTRKDKFQTLRNIGEFEKIEALDKLAINFLKANLAHDDIKVALDGLTERDMNDVLWMQIQSAELDTSKTSDLRRIVAEIRLNNSSVDLVMESRNFSQRVYGKLLSNPDFQVIVNVRTELESLMAKLSLLQSSAESAV